MIKKYFLSQPDFLIYTVVSQTYYENSKKCVLTLAKEPVAIFSPIAFTMKKNGPYTQAINEQYFSACISGIHRF